MGCLSNGCAVMKNSMLAGKCLEDSHASLREPFRRWNKGVPKIKQTGETLERGDSLGPARNPFGEVTPGRRLENKKEGHEFYPMPLF